MVTVFYAILSNSNSSCTYHCRNEFEVHAHFVGTTRYVDNYRIVFQTLPFVPYAGENSTLNFSILDENNSNIGNLYAALTIKSKDPENISRIPYRFYEFSDITFPYKFLKNGNYETILEAKILGNPKYEVKSLISRFDFAVGLSPVFSPDRLIYYFVLFLFLALAGILVYSRSKKIRNL